MLTAAGLVFNICKLHALLLAKGGKIGSVIGDCLRVGLKACGKLVIGFGLGLLAEVAVTDA